MSSEKPEALTKEQAPEVKAVVPAVETTTPAATPEDPAEAEWENLEMQRDLAFKIVYFFIFFIMGTFGLLYAYFKLDQKEQQKEAKSGQNVDQGTFLEFLAGQMDDPNY